MKQKFLFLITLAVTVLLSCSKNNLTQTTELTQTKDNFHQNQANEIIDKTTKNKKRRERHKEKRRLKEEERLNELNNPEKNKTKKTAQKPKFKFY